MGLRLMSKSGRVRPPERARLGLCVVSGNFHERIVRNGKGVGEVMRESGLIDRRKKERDAHAQRAVIHIAAEPALLSFACV